MVETEKQLFLEEVIELTNASRASIHDQLISSIKDAIILAAKAGKREINCNSNVWWLPSGIETDKADITAAFDFFREEGFTITENVNTNHTNISWP